MPRDDWKRANSRARYGPAPHKKPKSKRRKRKSPIEFDRGRQDEKYAIWFGKLRGVRIRDAPIDDLVQLLEMIDWAKKPRTACLAAFLREYLTEHAPRR